MRLRSSCASFALFCSSLIATAQIPAPTCADLNIVPAVRECTAVKVAETSSFAVRVSARGDGEDQFAAEDLKSYLNGGGESPHTDGDGPAVLLERAATPEASKQLRESHLAFDPAMHDEGYVLLPAGKNLAVIAETSAGLFYGAQTVKQLIRGSGSARMLLVPTIRDWPAMPHRGLSDDWSRGPLPNMEFVKREIRTLAAYKYNIFSPY
ncbi:MAG TPA: glycoside hydrolase family 20 zincin-like fold domain-containing protein, partial [Terracidiphilus sp.]